MKRGTKIIIGLVVLGIGGFFAWRGGLFKRGEKVERELEFDFQGDQSGMVILHTIEPHGLKTGDKIKIIEEVGQGDYEGVHTVTLTGCTDDYCKEKLATEWFGGIVGWGEPRGEHPNYNIRGIIQVLK